MSHELGSPKNNEVGVRNRIEDPERRIGEPVTREDGVTIEYRRIDEHYIALFAHEIEKSVIILYSRDDVARIGLGFFSIGLQMIGTAAYTAPKDILFNARVYMDQYRSE